MQTKEEVTILISLERYIFSWKLDTSEESQQLFDHLLGRQPGLTTISAFQLELLQVPPGEGRPCPVASGGCTVHTGRTLHFTGNYNFFESLPFKTSNYARETQERQINWLTREKAIFVICSCVLGANRTERARRAYIINCRPKVKFRKGSILQQLLRVSLRSNFLQAMVDLERAKKFDHGLAGVDDILPEHEKWYIELYLTLKIPSEMEVAPRYNCRNCWHCWHC